MRRSLFPLSVSDFPKKLPLHSYWQVFFRGRILIPGNQGDDLQFRRHDCLTDHSKGNGKRLDASIVLVLFLSSLAVNYLHWLNLPVTPTWDASRLGLHARDLLQENLLPFYIYHQLAPHPLIVYLQAFAFSIFGYSLETLQGVTVVGVSLAAPAIFWVCRLQFEEEGTSLARRAGLIAGLGYALSGHVASFSRLGSEPPLLPVVEVIAVAFLLRGFRRGKWTDFVLAGLFVGASQYVYIVSRFFPAALAAATIGSIIANHQLIAHWRRLLLAFIASSLVSLPQWVLFAVYPFTFNARVSNRISTLGGQFVFELPDPAGTVAAKLLGQMSAIFWQWDTWYYTYTSNSLLTPVLAIGLVVGIVVTVVKRREGLIFGLLIMVLMLLPDLLTYERYELLAVSSNRFFAGTPFIFIMAGMGIATVWAALECRGRFPLWIGYLLPAIVLLSGLSRQWVYVIN